jgi:hypothetical protein
MRWDQVRFECCKRFHMGRYAFPFGGYPMHSCRLFLLDLNRFHFVSFFMVEFPSLSFLEGRIWRFSFTVAPLGVFKKIQLKGDLSGGGIQRNKCFGLYLCFFLSLHYQERKIDNGLLWLTSNKRLSDVILSNLTPPRDSKWKVSLDIVNVGSQSLSSQLENVRCRVGPGTIG